MPFSDAAQCNATAKSTGNPCRNPAVNGSTKCRLHGGKTPRGANSPNFKHGGRSKYIPQRIMGIYEELADDTEYTDLRANMRLREMFIREKLALLDDAPDSAKVWSDINKLWLKMQRAFKGDDYGTLSALFTEGQQLLDERLVYFETQKEIRADLTEQRKDSQAIAAIEYKGENAVTMTEVLTFVGAVLNLVTAHVNDNQAKNAIFNGIDKLVSVETRDTNAVKRLTY